MKNTLLLSLALLALAPAAFAGGGKPVDPNAPEASAPPASISPGTTNDGTPCYEYRCVGDRVWVSRSDYYVKEVTIKSITPDSKFIVQWSDGSVGPQGGFAAENLALSQNNHKGIQCLGPYCLGEEAIINDREYHVKRVIVVGLLGSPENPRYIMQWLNDKSVGKSGGFDPESLAKIRNGGKYACGRELCVGDKAYVNRSDYYVKPVTVAAITRDGRYIVSWADGSIGPVNGFAYSELSQITKRERSQDELDEEEVDRLAKDPNFDINVYKNSRAAGKTHPEAKDLALGPVWTNLSDTQSFVNKLSRYVYQFDASYLQQVSRLIPNDQNRERASLFVSMALLPYLKSFGYQGLRERYVTPSSKSIEAMLQARQLTSLEAVESTIFSRRIALQMLAASLQTSMVQMDASQKERATQFLRLIGDALATPMRVRDLGDFLRAADDLQRLFLELTQNPYLQGRAAADMGILSHVRNS